jgi:hypothetical protein
MSRDEILPTYRIPALVRAPGHQVDQRGVEPLTSPGERDRGISTFPSSRPGAEERT